MRTRRPNAIAALLIASGIGGLAGCTAGGPAGGATDERLDQRSMRGVAASEAYAADRARDRDREPRSPTAERRTAGQTASVVAEVTPIGGGAGFRVDFDDLRARLVEAAGADVLEQWVLERVLEERCRRASIAVDEALLKRERALLIEALRRGGIDADDGAQTRRSQAEAERVLAQLRARRDLGPTRFAGTLRRSAMLRALVQDDVAVTDEQVNLAHALRHGPRYRVRVITAETLAAVRAAVAEVEAGEAVDVVARRRSTDVSAARGGAIDPVSPADPLVPQALRRALRELAQTEGVGALTAPVRLENGYAVAVLDAVEPGDGVPLSSVRADLERIVRLRQERLLMDEMSRRILASVEVRPMEASWRWAWRTREPGEGGTAAGPN